MRRGHGRRRCEPALLVLALALTGIALVPSTAVATVPPGLTVFDVPATARCHDGAKTGSAAVRWGEAGISGVDLAVDQGAQKTSSAEEGRATLRVPCDGDVHTIGASFSRPASGGDPAAPPLFLEERILTRPLGQGSPTCPRRIVQEQAEFDARQYAPDVTADNVRCSDGIARATIHFPPPQPATAEPVQVYAYAANHAVRVGGQSLEQEGPITYRTCSLPARSLRALDLPAQQRRGGVDERNCGLG